MKKKADSDRIKEELQSFAEIRETSFKDASVDEMWDNFESHIHHIIPHKMTSSRYSLPWFNRSLRRQSRTKQRLYNKAKKSGNPVHWNEFRSARKRLQKKSVFGHISNN